jgi:hypothetical protein
MCGGVGNCPSWIIGEKPSLRVLLATYEVQTFALQDVRASGYFDLYLGNHDSAMVTNVERFRFEGTRYRSGGCASIAWSDGFGDVLRPPRISSRRCN